MQRDIVGSQMKFFFTADNHFNHRRIIEYCNRPFANREEMDSEMISRWNEVVPKDGVVYCLGDLILAGRKRTEETLSQLNGNIYLCLGDHDKSAIKYGLKHLEGTARDYVIKIGDAKVFMSHYCHKVWPKSHYGAWHLFGHSHGGMNAYAMNEGKLLDVGVDSHDFRPWTFAEIREAMLVRPDNFNLIKSLRR